MEPAEKRPRVSLASRASRRVAARSARVLRAVAVFALASLLAPAASSALPSISAKHFEKAATCVCHTEQQADWQKSMHADALTDPVYLVEKEMAVADLGAGIGVFCDTCHTPIGTMAGQTAPGKKLSAQSKEGVTCDFCHQVVGTAEPIGGASQRMRANDKKRAQLKRASAPTHVNVYSSFHETAEFCGSCHNLRHPVTGAVLDSTYDEWKAGPYAEQGIVCQDCHMSEGPGVGQLTGRAAAIGPLRSDIYLMTFAGANVGLGNAQRARTNLKAAARVSLTGPSVLAKGERGTLKVRVANVGAGHSIPGGASEIRQMWLEVSAVLPGGARKVLGTRRFGTVHKDAKGSYPAGVWEAAGIQSDDRIKPKQTVASEYRFEMPAAGSVRYEAVLKYASFPSQIAHKAGVSNPVTEMARDSVTIHGSKLALNRARGLLFGVIDPVAVGALLIVALVALAAMLTHARLRARGRTRP